MKLKIILMGSFKELEASDIPTEFPDGTTMDDVLEVLGIPGPEVQIVLRNGKPAGDRSVACDDGDTLTILPLVGGG